MKTRPMDDVVEPDEVGFRTTSSPRHRKGRALSTKVKRRCMVSRDVHEGGNRVRFALLAFFTNQLQDSSRWEEFVLWHQI